jgi:4-amino-4-deoxy-L-arabinose transferase-like glycosyltransferase
MTTDCTVGSSESFFDRQRNVILLLAAIVLLALILEIPTLNMGRWLDECLNVASASQPDLPALIRTMYGRMEDQHPPLSYILLFFFMRVFGSGDIAIRTPSLICGLLLIPATYWLGSTVHSKAAGLLAALFVAISPIANYLLCQSRPYALATLISAVTLTLYCKLVDDKNEGQQTATFIGLVLMVAALCYTEYSSCPMIPALALASVVIYCRDRWAPAPAPQPAAKFKRCMAALFLGGALFIPWIPSVLIQAHVGAPLMQPTPLSDWPLAFGYNLLLATVPLPMIVTIPLSAFAAVAVLFLLIKHRRRLPDVKSLFFSIPDAYWVLAWAVAFPALVLELIIPMSWGYYRYVFPYSPAGWVLLAIAMLRLFDYGRVSRKIRIFLPLTLVFMLAVDIFYLCWFDGRPQSGTRSLAQDVRAGKFDGCVLLIAPDYICQTLDYYLPLSERTAHHIVLCGFPRWDNPMAPVKMSEIPPMWRSETVVGEAEQHLADLTKQGWKKLAFATNAEMLDRLHSNPAIPRAERVSELRSFIEEHYKKLPLEQEYPGATEALKVSFFQLQR